MKKHAVQERCRQNGAPDKVAAEKQKRRPEQDCKQSAESEQSGHSHGQIVMRDHGQEEPDPERVQDMIVRGGNIGKDRPERDVHVVLHRPNLIVFRRVPQNVHDPDRSQDSKNDKAYQDKALSAALVLHGLFRRMYAPLFPDGNGSIGGSGFRRMCGMLLTVIHDADPFQVGKHGRPAAPVMRRRIRRVSGRRRKRRRAYRREAESVRERA